MKSSTLSEIDGVGEKTATLLLKHFKSIKNIKSATEEELVKSGINKKTAENIYQYFNKK